MSTTQILMMMALAAMVVTRRSTRNRRGAMLVLVAALLILALQWSALPLRFWAAGVVFAAAGWLAIWPPAWLRGSRGG